MRSVERWRRGLAGIALGLLASCGGGNSSESTLITRDGALPFPTGVEVVISEPQGSNTVEVVVDQGPGSGFALGVTNLPYVTVTVCRPGAAADCVTIDHVFLDTGSIGLRLLRSAVADLALPLQTDGSGTVTECFPFVIGAVWGPLASADVRIGGESAPGLPVQLIDDGEPALAAAPADCVAAANGDLLRSKGALQAKGVLGVGMLAYDCGQVCEQGDYSNGFTLYYRCTAGAGCTPLAVPAERQVRNPVAHFAVNNNGTVIALPAVPDTGAALARGRLIFGIGTQANNQLPPAATVLRVQADTARDDYLYLTTTVDGRAYPFSYIDSGSNGLFFDDTGLPSACLGAGAGATWYCPATTRTRSAEITDSSGARAAVPFSVASADVLFATGNIAFGNLGGAAGPANAGAFVWGLPFFYGRRVHTAIWGQALATQGPWYAF